MPILGTIPRQGAVEALASQAQQKINATIEANRIAIPIQTPTRRFVVIKDLKTTEPVLNPFERPVEVQEFTETRRGRKLSPMEVTYSGPLNIIDLLRTRISEETLLGIAPDILILAGNSESYVHPQPVKEEITYQLDEGFQGALNRVLYMVQHNDQLFMPPLDFDYYIGIENGVVPFHVDDPELGRRQEMVPDIGFVCIRDYNGVKRYANSAGVIFGENLAVDLFQESARTGFEIPLGHLYDPIDKQDPHNKATLGNFPREKLLYVPIVTAMVQLPPRRLTSSAA